MRITDKIHAYNMDCMEFMKDKPDNYYDLAICDPPYGIGIFTSEYRTDKNGMRRKKNKNYKDNYEWNNEIPIKEYFNEIKRVSKKRIIWGANYYNCFENGHSAIVWYKGKMTETMSHCEIASKSWDKKVDFVHVNWQSGFYRKITEGLQIHPCQKPIKLYKWLLDKYGNQGDKILDTHGGSMSIGVACHDYGFDLDICETDKDYFDNAVKRLINHAAQTTLFS